MILCPVVPQGKRDKPAPDLMLLRETSHARETRAEFFQLDLFLSPPLGQGRGRKLAKISGVPSGGGLKNGKSFINFLCLWEVWEVFELLWEVKNPCVSRLLIHNSHISHNSHFLRACASESDRPLSLSASLDPTGYSRIS